MLLVDQFGCVLLFAGIDRTKSEVPPWWFPVGGGIEPGESPEEAAVRETFEETGLSIKDVGPVLFLRRVKWEFEGTEYDQEELYFLVRTDRFEPSSSAWTELESATFRGHRWWSVADLRVTTETVFPEGLAEHLNQSVDS